MVKAMNNYNNDKVVLFGAGKIGRKCFNSPRRNYDIVAVIDNNKDLIGTMFAQNVPIIGIDEYLEKYREYDIIITPVDCKAIEEQLKQRGIYNYHLYYLSTDWYNHNDVPIDKYICHDNWKNYLQEHFDVEGKSILEVGSRNVVGGRTREWFKKANYVGFDYYAGENVDVVGDAHELSKYFDQQFDLIFSSAVFEHLAMPWKVAIEIIKLLKTGGCVFIETHYSYVSHERPWHFFQYSENALDILFPAKFGMKCLRKGCSNLIEGRFSAYASQYLQGQCVGGIYCHSEYLGQKEKEVEDLSWNNVCLEDVVGATKYPLN